ncbi:hypothetical protein STSU_000065 (plasmid) [Streptomyces tsukubensis NRRL18488]|uniref:Uncharacterized protein n=2 Tax=Streptomyces TaxID=1883 RepID=I2MT31_STRT9|nr:hypothetical protein [Streptomyces tsukubensis NRRL18488]QKM65782.1 hypothetical protein STSU_000065 [Streptomyces tsukubensis NRRL18488]
MAALWSDLRPYLPTRTNLSGPLSGVGAGSVVLLGRGWKWLWAEGPHDAAIRAGGVALGVYATINTVPAVAGPYAPFMPSAAAVGWCIAAKLHAPSKGKKTETPGTAEPDDVTEDPGDADSESIKAHAPEEIDVDDVVRLIRDIAARNGHQGTHLDDLVAQPLFEGWLKAELKAELTTRWGFHVENFKLFFDGRQRNRDGVRLRHLPETPADPIGEGLAEGSARGLSLVPRQPPAGPPASSSAEAADNPSPTRRRAPSQGHG